MMWLHYKSNQIMQKKDELNQISQTFLLKDYFIPEAQFASKMRFHLLSHRTKPDGSLR